MDKNKDQTDHFFESTALTLELTKQILDKLQFEKLRRKKAIVTLHDQGLMHKAITESYRIHRPITLLIRLQTGETAEITGVVTGINQVLERIRMLHLNGMEWVPKDRIIGIKMELIS
ncbi:hypothetical protein ABNB74_08880 [Paenibacillus larvae]